MTFLPSPLQNSLVAVSAASVRLMQSWPGRLLVVPCLASVLGGAAYADLVLETETAQLGKQGDCLVSTAIQFEREKDGTTATFTLNQFEYAITDRAEILIEPFFYEKDRPSDGASFHGVGDLEITPSYMVILEEPTFPAILLAFKLKVPTATDRKIGTGKFDYQPYVILGKTSGPWVFNANFGYDFVTSPRDEPLSNQWIYDLSVERKMTDDLSLFAECFGNSRPARREKGTFAWALAAEYRLDEHFSVFASVGDDTDRLKNLRFGFNFEW